MFDSRKEIRVKAVNLIIQAREDEDPSKIHKNELPKEYIDFYATCYFQMLPFDTLPRKFLQSPPLLRNVSNEELIKCANFEVELEIPNLGGHS